MTNYLAALIAGVPRFRIEDNLTVVPDNENGNWITVNEVLAALEAAPVPDLGEVLAKAEKVEAEVVSCFNGSDHVLEDAADTIRALIALCQAQAAQIAGMREDITHWRGAADGHFNQAMKNGSAAVQERTRAEAAEAKVAELEAQVVAEKEENRWAYIQAAMDDKQTDAETEAATLRAEVERLRGALDQIAWSNDSKWQADCARAALEGKA